MHAQLDMIIEKGRKFTLRSLFSKPTTVVDASAVELKKQCLASLSAVGEASGTKLSTEIHSLYANCSHEERVLFFDILLNDFAPDEKRVLKACEFYTANLNASSLDKLIKATEPPRQELFRRLNQAPEGTSLLVSMRSDLLECMKMNSDLKPVDTDLLHLFRSWFNRGFLTMQQISWSSPAVVLERLIKYEAVHEIGGWNDLKTRLQPPDRRCYAFFHPALIEDPLIFVEIAFSNEVPSSVQYILSDEREFIKAEQANTATFYSISNCQKGLKGVSFGNFLIKQVVGNLRASLPNLNRFVTLSPLPGFVKWLHNEAPLNDLKLHTSDISKLSLDDWHQDSDFADSIKQRLMKAAALYLTSRRPTQGKLIDSVARFHLGNGARLESLNWLADVSNSGFQASYGIMVNYLYQPSEIEKNHEAFRAKGEVVMSNEIKKML